MRYRHFLIWSSLLAITITACAAAVVAAPMFNRQHPPINQTTFNAIKFGMAEEEVHAILGGPPADYTGGRFSVLTFT